MQSITLNGTSYAVADLSESARSQLNNIQAVDAEIARLQRQLAIAQTARNSYVSSLADELEVKTPAPATAKSASRSPGKATPKPRTKKA